MRAQHLRTYLLLLLLFFVIFTISTVDAYEGYWIATGQDYIGYFEPLLGNSQWTFNASRGPTERWGINFTISGFGLHPTTLLVCDEVDYNQWLDTGSSSHCQYTTVVNYSLHTIVDLPHQSQWYFVLNNTGSLTLYFTLRLTRYQWSTNVPTTPTNPVESLSSLFVYILVIGVIVLIVIPCVCNVSCLGFSRRRSKKQVHTKEVHHQTTILVVTPEQLETFNDDEEH
ncbi:MAG: hypothetical protein ACFE9D_12065 [Promethearchaeota archaeon]